MTWKDYGNDCREEGIEIGREEGIEIGREEGREEGIEIGREEDICKMLKNGKTPEQISDFCGYDLNYVRTVANKFMVET